MSVTYGFYNSVNGDRKYNTSNFSELFDGILNDGVFMNVGNVFKILPAGGMNITLGSGRAWFNSTWTYNDAPLPLVIGPAEVVLNRIDTVVLEVNHALNVRTNTFKVITGTPGQIPIPPTLTNNTEIHQHPLAHIAINAEQTEITTTNITPLVGTSVCPFVSGILETANIDYIYDKWDAQFEEFLRHLEYELSDDVAGNLQVQIDRMQNPNVEGSLAQQINMQTAAASKTVFDSRLQKLRTIRSGIGHYEEKLLHIADQSSTSGTIGVNIGGLMIRNGKLISSMYIQEDTNVYTQYIMIWDLQTFVLEKKCKLNTYSSSDSMALGFQALYFSTIDDLALGFYSTSTRNGIYDTVNEQFWTNAYSDPGPSFMSHSYMGGRASTGNYTLIYKRRDGAGTNVTYSFPQAFFHIGFHEDTLYVTLNSGQASSLGKITLADTSAGVQVATGIEQYNFTLPSPGILIDNRYYMARTSTNKIYVLDFYTGTSNYQNMEQTSSNSIVSQQNYLGTFENSMFFCNTDEIVEIDKATWSIKSTRFSQYNLRQAGANSLWSYETIFTKGIGMKQRVLYDMIENVSVSPTNTAGDGISTNHVMTYNGGIYEMPKIIGLGTQNTRIIARNLYMTLAIMKETVMDLED